MLIKNGSQTNHCCALLCELGSIPPKQRGGDTYPSSATSQDTVYASKCTIGVDVWQVTRYLGYSSLTDFFPTMDIKPNPGCANPACQKLQAAFQLLYNSEKAVAARSAAAAAAACTKEEAAMHEDNDWGIEVVNDASPAAASAGPCTAGQQDGLAAGLQYSFPVRLQMCFFAAKCTSKNLLAVRLSFPPESARAGMHIEVRSIVVVMRSSACSSICAGN